MSSLTDFKNKRLQDYEQRVSQAPPISAALLQHMESMFVPERLNPDDPYMNNKLVFQAGINRVLDYMRGLHERQEKEIRDRFSKDS